MQKLKIPGLLMLHQPVPQNVNIAGLTTENILFVHQCTFVIIHGTKYIVTSYITFHILKVKLGKIHTQKNICI